MIQVKLKKLLRKPELISILDNFPETFNLLFFISDLQGTVLWGEFNSEFNYHFDIIINEHILGNIYGEKKEVETIYHLINYIVKQEFDKKILAADTLEKYEEINFLSNISYQLSSCLNFQEILEIVSKETNKLLDNCGIYFMFLNEKGELDIFTYKDQILHKSKGTISSIEGHVLRSGKAEIFNNVNKDSRYIADDCQVKSVICAPLKVQNKTIGVIKVSNCKSIDYTSEELKLFTSLTSQAAVAIKTAQYYDKLTEYSQALEQKVFERTQEVEQSNRELTQAKERLEHLATIDEITQIYNRRYFNEYLDREWRRLARERKFISLILGDVDYFKLYNDCYLHQAGDKCLYRVAQYLKILLKRPTDLVARFGGEEFVIILSNTNSLGAEKVAQKIRSGIEGLQIPHCLSKCSSYVTLSLGVATTIPTPQVAPQKLIKAADQALYQAKAKGRNCFCLSEFRPSIL